MEQEGSFRCGSPDARAPEERPPGRFETRRAWASCSTSGSRRPGASVPCTREVLKKFNNENSVYPMREQESLPANGQKQSPLCPAGFHRLFIPP